MSIASEELGPVRRSTITNRPDEKVDSNGVTFNSATISRVVMRTVKCADSSGAEAPGEEYSHIKTTMLSFRIMEYRRDQESGMYEMCSVDLSDKSKISAAKVKLNGETFDLGDGKGKQLELIFEKATLPVQGLLSMQYASPKGGNWYVDEHALDINFVDPKQNACCALM